MKCKLYWSILTYIRKIFYKKKSMFDKEETMSDFRFDKKINSLDAKFLNEITNDPFNNAYNSIQEEKNKILNKALEDINDLYIKNNIPWAKPKIK